MSDTESATSFSYSRPQSRNGTRQSNLLQSPHHHHYNVSFSPKVTHPSEASGSTIKPLAARRQQQQQQSQQDNDNNGDTQYLRMPAVPRHQMSFSLLAKQDLRSANVFGIIHRMRRDIKRCIETALTYEQLNSPKLVFGVVRPLQNAYLKLDSPCTIYALLLNRVYFDSQQYTLSSLSVNNTRAMLCEILAIKVLRALYEEDTSENGVFRLAILLASTFSPFQGAPDWAIPENMANNLSRGGGEIQENDRKISTSALELAIVSEAKRFIRAVPTQKVIMDIWRGKIVYSTNSFRYLIKDQYKKRPIMKYNIKNAPLLDHYRLRVPRIRAALEWFHFFILFISYLVVLRTMQEHRMNGYEIFWVVFAFGFALDKFASLLELGWTVFNSNLWNGLDFIFILMFIVYLPLRLIGLRVDRESAATEALSILTCAGCILFPRFAFTTLSDNLLILSLRSMLAQFTKLMFLAVWCFAGFFLAFVTLGDGKFKSMEIIQWMIWIWFGLDSTGLKEANKLHNVLGPILMVIYSCLSSTLLLTVLVSILSNTFNQINKDSIAEKMYRKAVSTFQGVKSDGIFSFQPPINILALLILKPLSFFVDKHYYHKIIVFAARFTNLPLLLLIRFIERQFLFRDYNNNTYFSSNGNNKNDDRKDYFISWFKPWNWFLYFNLDLFGGTRTELNAVFEIEDDIDDDLLPRGAFDIIVNDGSMTPNNNNATAAVGESTPLLGGAGGNSSTEDNSDYIKSAGQLLSSAPATTTTTTTSATSTRTGRGDTPVDLREDTLRSARERSRQRRTQSMSDWGGTIASSTSTPRARPTILSKLYGYGSSRGSSNPHHHQHQYTSYESSNNGTIPNSARTTNTTGSSRLSSLWLNSSNNDDEENDENEIQAEREALKQRLERIEEGQKRIEEALKALGGGEND